MSGQTRHIHFALVALVALAGCSQQPEADLKQMRNSVVASLDAWKTSPKLESLKSHTPPIEFHDDDRQRGAKLTSYEINQTYRDTDGAPRCAVTLNLQFGTKTKTIKATYQANMSSPEKIIIARDPYS